MVAVLRTRRTVWSTRFSSGTLEPGTLFELLSRGRTSTGSIQLKFKELTMADTSHRGSWDNWLEFFFSALGSMVGLGNIWRFPYVCYRSGGGAFLLPFVIAMFLCGCPLLFLETLYCQYSSRGPGRVWEICPLFKGIGFGMLTMTAIISVYYTVIMSWTLYYVAMSCQAELPWASCGHGWNSDACAVRNFTVMNDTLASTSINVSTSNMTSKVIISPEEEFWFKQALSLSPSLSDTGYIKWELLLCLAVAWAAVFLCLFKGINQMGRVAYVAATIPYVILTILLVRGCLLPGAGTGIYYYLAPVWGKLLEFDVWRSAATQVMYSIGMGFGLISTLASYNKFNNNCHRDALILPVLDCATSVYAGLAIFAFLGHMTYLTGKPIEEVVAEGPGLVFIAYPAAPSTLPAPQFWSLIFFLMLFCVGLDSQFLHVQGVTTALADCFPDHLLTKRTQVTAVVCLVSFILGIPFTTQSGYYLLNLFDWYVASFCLMLLVLMETVVLAYVYGTNRLYDDLESMLGFRPSWVWAISWKFVTPAFLLVLWLTGLIQFKTIGSSNPGYPAWSDGLGIAVACIPILPVPIKAAWTLYQGEGKLRTRLMNSIQPSVLWRPAGQHNDDEENKEMENFASSS